jgi:hypothetical protein
MTKVSYLFGFIILSILAVNFAVFNNAIGSGDMISQDKAVEIANEEITILGYNLKNMEIRVSFHENPWNEYLPRNDTSKYVSVRKNKLEDKKYWAVYYFVKTKNDQITVGGDVCIFIDANTGEIITNYRGK